VLASVSEATPRRLAVVVGANTGASWQVSLRHAERDALKFAAVLREVGDVAPGDLRLLTREPTAQSVQRALSEADARAAAIRAKGQDVALFFYYSGHATRKGLRLSGTLLPMDELRKYLIESKATTRLAILDACHSGSATRGKGGVRDKQKTSLSLAEGYAILTSSAADEESQESDELLGGFFTHHLVSALRGAADRDDDGQVTLGGAYRYAYKRTLRETVKRTTKMQHPHFDMALKGGQDVVLTSLKGAQSSVRVSGSSGSAQWVIFQPASGLVVAELDERPRTTTTVAVPAGELEVYRRSDSGVARGEIDTRGRPVVQLSQDKLQDVPVTAYLYKGEVGLSVSAQVGVATYGSPSMRTEYAAVSPLFSVVLQYQGLFHYALGAALDVSFAHARQDVTLKEGTSKQRLVQLQVGAALPYTFDSGSFSFALGPRVALLYLHRDKEVSGVELEADDVVTVAAGGAFKASWRIARSPVSIGLEGRLSYVPIPTDGGDRNELLVETQATAGFHF